MKIEIQSAYDRIEREMLKFMVDGALVAGSIGTSTT